MQTRINDDATFSNMRRSNMMRNYDPRKQKNSYNIKFLPKHDDTYWSESLDLVDKFVPNNLNIQNGFLGQYNMKLLREGEGYSDSADISPYCRSLVHKKRNAQQLMAAKRLSFQE